MKAGKDRSLFLPFTLLATFLPLHEAKEITLLWEY